MYELLQNFTECCRDGQAFIMVVMNGTADYLEVNIGPIVVPQPLQRTLCGFAKDNERWRLTMGCFMTQFNK